MYFTPLLAALSLNITEVYPIHSKLIEANFGYTRLMKAGTNVYTAHCAAYLWKKSSWARFSEGKPALQQFYQVLVFIKRSLRKKKPSSE